MTIGRVEGCGSGRKSMFSDALTLAAMGENDGIRRGLRKIINDLRRDKDDLPYISATDLRRYIDATIEELEDLL